MAVIPIENFAPSSGTTNDYFYPNFIPTNLWSYGDVGQIIVHLGWVVMVVIQRRVNTYDNKLRLSTHRRT